MLLEEKTKHKRKKHPFTCPNCGETYYTYSKGKATKPYCSRWCYPSHRDTWLTLNCNYCGTEIKRTKDATNRNKNNFCSRECANKFKTGPTGKVKNRSLKKCKYCGKYKMDYKKSKRQYCSQQCAGKAKEFTSNIKLTLKSLFGRQSKKARERDGYKCQRCGMTNGESLKKYKRQLSVHHIIPYVFFKEDNEEQHNLDNLITVCHSCHMHIHATETNPADYDFSKIRTM